MHINRVKIVNFKSFKEIDVNLQKFNVLIGANASGKSNFVQAFKFLRDLAKRSLGDAISIQGGVEYFRNIIIGSSVDSMIQITSNTQRKRIISENKGLKIDGIVFTITVRYGKRGNIAKTEQSLKVLAKLYEVEEDKKERKGKSKNYRELDLIEDGELNFFQKNNGIIIKSTFNPKNFDAHGYFPNFNEPFIREVFGIHKGNLLLSQFLPLSFAPYGMLFTDMSTFDFECKLPKKSVPITGSSRLEENGENLAIVLKTIFESKELKRKFINLIQDILPFVDKFDTQRVADKSLLIRVKETFYEKQYLPASLVSDGTIAIIALITALYFVDTPLLILEETERSIHPHLISKILSMMSDASKDKQILVSTHNPLFVRHSELDNLLFVSRNNDGYSTITRPADQISVQTFLKNEIGIEDLFIDNQL